MSDYVTIPEHTKEKMKKIELAVDMMFVNKIPFLISIGKKVEFATNENVADWKAYTLLKVLRIIKSVHTNKNIFITTLCMDYEFEVLHKDFQYEGLALNNTAADENVPQIERQIKVLKERLHSTWNLLPSQKFPVIMISCMV